MVVELVRETLSFPKMKEQNHTVVGEEEQEEDTVLVGVAYIVALEQEDIVAVE